MADADVIATATALTAESVLEGYRRFVWPHLGQAAPLAKTEFVVAGGGAKNAALMGMLRAGLRAVGSQVCAADGGAGGSGTGQGGCGVRSTGVVDVAWTAGECSGGDRGGAGGGAGEGDVLSFFLAGRWRTVARSPRCSAPLANTINRLAKMGHPDLGEAKEGSRGASTPPHRERQGRAAWVARMLGTAVMAGCLLTVGCRGRREDPGTVVVLIESSPNNLDLRQGTDAQSERVGALIFDALVKKDAHYTLQPWLATRWEQPDALTWVIHLRDGVRFQDARPLTAADVVWTIESLINGSLMSAKSGNFAAVERVEARDRLTVVVHLKRPDAGLPFNMSDGLFGVVPKGAGRDFGLHPVGTGPWRFVSAVQDKEVILERNPNYWAGVPAPPAGGRAIRAAAVCSSTGPDHDGARDEEGLGGSREQCDDVGYGACTARCGEPADGDRAEFGGGVHELQRRGSGAQRQARAAGDCVRNRPAGDCECAVAGTCSAG